MKNSFLSALLIAALVAYVALSSTASAGEAYPRACVDAYAVVQAARGYSAKTPAYRWDLVKLSTALGQFRACISEAQDNSDVGYAVGGMIYVNELIASVWYWLAYASPGFNEPARERYRDFNRNKKISLAYLADAKALIDKANTGGSRLDDDDLETVDKLYERYKQQHSELSLLSYDGATKLLAKANAIQPSAHAKSAVSVETFPTVPIVAKVTASPAAVPSPCDEPNRDSHPVHSISADLPALARQQGISGDVTVSVSLDEQSQVVTSRIIKSPSPLLNGAAINAVGAATYQTRLVNCAPVSDTFNLIVELHP